MCLCCSDHQGCYTKIRGQFSAHITAVFAVVGITLGMIVSPVLLHYCVSVSLSVRLSFQYTSCFDMSLRCVIIWSTFPTVAAPAQ